MKILFFAMAVFFFESCVSQERKIVFINQSGVEIDSVFIGVSSKEVYTIRLTKVKSGDTINNIILKNRPESNKHDITVDVTVFIKNYPPIYEFTYNDLIGYLNHNYIVTLNDKKKIEWKIHD